MITVRITGLRGKFWQNNGIENPVGDLLIYILQLWLAMSSLMKKITL